MGIYKVKGHELKVYEWTDATPSMIYTHCALVFNILPPLNNQDGDGDVDCTDRCLVLKARTMKFYADNKTRVGLHE